MIYPTGVAGKDKIRPTLTYAIIAVNVIVYVWELLYLRFYGVEAFTQVMFNIAFNVCEIGSRSFMLLALDSLRSMFLHGPGNFHIHLIGNMLMLFIFGRKIEAYFGKIPFLAFYLLAGYGSTIGHAMFGGAICSPADPNGLVIGASGAIAGVMGAFLLLFPTLPVRTHISIIPPFIGWQLKVPAMFYLLYFFLLDFLSGLGWYIQEETRVAHWGHIGGFIVGFVIVFLTTMLWKPVPKADPFAYLDD